MNNAFRDMHGREGRFIRNALPPVSFIGTSANRQRVRVFIELNEELAGRRLKYRDLADRIGEDSAMELYLRGLVEHGIRPARVAISSSTSSKDAGHG